MCCWHEIAMFERNLSFFSFRNLYIARPRNPVITRYNPADQTTEDISYDDGSAQSISVDENNVIYWVNYDSNEELFFVMRTLPNEQTVKLNISYSGEIDLTSDTLNFYVLDNGNNVIDQYSKTSFQKLANITHSSSIHDLVIAYGKFNHSNDSKL